MTTSIRESHVISGDVVLRVLRIGLHVSFAVLLAIGVARMVESSPGTVTMWLGLGLAVCLAGMYLAGTIVEKRAADAGSYGTGSTAGSLPLVWLGTVTAVWAALVLLHADFSWLAFPLFFLHVFLLRLPIALVTVTLITAAVVVTQWNAHDQLMVATVLGPLIGAAFAVLMALAYQSLHSDNLRLKRTLDELSGTRQILARSQREAGALAEREKLAREIHDTLAQGLSSIVLMFRAAVGSLDAGNADEARSRLDTVHTAAAENLTEARGFVRQLNAGQDPAESLTEGLRRACTSLERQAAARGENLRCRLEVNGEPYDLDPSHAVALLRTAQSSLSNVALHAGASAAVVTLSFLPTQVALDIFDDGHGFDLGDTQDLPGPRPDGSGFGLTSIRDRITTLGGRFDVETAPGEGTIIAVRLPVNTAGTAASEDREQSGHA